MHTEHITLCKNNITSIHCIIMILNVEIIYSKSFKSLFISYVMIYTYIYISYRIDNISCDKRKNM